MIDPSSAARRVGAGLLLTLLSACAPHVQSWLHKDTDPQLLDDAFLASDGARLPLTRWEPVSEPRAVMIVVHGFNDYRGAFDLAGPYLAEHGVQVYAYDQRGFGGAPKRGTWPGAEKMTRDLHELIEQVRNAHPELPLYVLGDSMGSAVVISAMSHANAPRVSGLVFNAPAVWGKDTFNGFYRVSLWLMAHTVPWATATGKGFRVVISDNTEWLRRMARDSMMIRETRFDVLYGLVQLMDSALEKSAKLDQPTLVLYGKKDRVIPRRSVCRMLDAMQGNAGSRAAFYPQGYHLLLRDLQRETVYSDILAWIDDSNADLSNGVADSCGPDGVVTQVATQ